MSIPPNVMEKIEEVSDSILKVRGACSRQFADIPPAPRLRRGKVIAALSGFSASKRFAFYECGMGPAWSRLSVGLVMMGCGIEEAIRTGHEEFDF